MGSVDSDSFKGEKNIEELENSIKKNLEKYVGEAKKLGFAADYRMSLATEIVEEVVKICRNISAEFSKTTVFSGQITFGLEKFYHKLLHNETAFSIQRTLQLDGITTIILPVVLKTEN